MNKLENIHYSDMLLHRKGKLTFEFYECLMAALRLLTKLHPWKMGATIHKFKSKGLDFPQAFTVLNGCIFG
jgi:hypothetical protein